MLREHLENRHVLVCAFCILSKHRAGRLGVLYVRIPTSGDCGSHQVASYWW